MRCGVGWRQGSRRVERAEDAWAEDAAGPEGTGPPARAPARQDRSRRTERAILDAVRELLEDRPFDDVSMADVARRADVSIGGLYGRFPGGKTGILQVLYRALLEEWSRTLAELLPDGREGRMTLEEVVGRYVRGMVQAFRRDRPLLNAAYRARWADALDPIISAEVRAFDRAAHARFLRFATAALPGDVPADRAKTVLQFALLQLSAAGRASILDRATRVYGLTEDPEQVGTEITTAAVAYIVHALDLRVGGGS